jgi:phosphohistidine phosphatase
MQLYLLRHADAETEAARDDLRQLSEKGRNQTQKVGRFFARQAIEPDVILTSPLIRAKQTAQIVAEEIHLESRVAVEDFIKCGMTPSDAFSGLRKFQETSSVLLVGHEPDLSHLVGALIRAPAGNVHVRKATLIKILAPVVETGGGVIEFFLPVKLL